MKLLFLFFALSTLLLAQEEALSSLLNSYEHESELSKITKREEAGVLDIYTHHDLEVMQAKTLEDVLRILPGFHLTRTTNNLGSLQKPTTKNIQLSTTRLYINDHDTSSTSFGSAALIWGALPIEYIDHIEIYKGAASIEFGNETASLIIKLYTKTPQHEEGGKVRLYGDNYGSANIDAYVASKKGELSYFAYANANSIKRKEYENSYNAKEYPLKSDHSGHNLYANLEYKKWILELASFQKKSDNLLGIGMKRTPSGGELVASHHYLHLSKKFENNLKLQLSYDNVSYEREYIDPNGIFIVDPTAGGHAILDDYNIKFDDEILAFIVEQKLKFSKHSLLLGSFYKHKSFTEHGDFENTTSGYLHTNSFSNALNLYSLYAEYVYDYDTSLRFVASLKEDIYDYSKVIPTTNELSAKVAVIKNIGDFQIKAFATSTYVPTPLFQLYNPENTPYKTNPNLKNIHIDIGILSFKYTHEKNRVSFVTARNHIEDSIVGYNKNLPYGYTNSDKSVAFTRFDLKYEYLFDLDNRFSTSIFSGVNSNNMIASPQYGAIVQLFSKYRKFDIYNELTIKSKYELYSIAMDASLNYTAAIKYHYSKDLSLGLRGENIFNSGYKQIYRGLDFAIPVTDQKIWCNMEYLF